MDIYSTLFSYYYYFMGYSYRVIVIAVYIYTNIYICVYSHNDATYTQHIYNVHNCSIRNVSYRITLVYVNLCIDITFMPS